MSIPTNSPSAAYSISLVCKATFIEMIRRKDFYVLSIFMLCYVIGALIIYMVGIENESTSGFLLSLGLSYAFLAAHILTILSIARQVPGEIETRTLYPLLAKPIERGTYFVGKWVAVVLVGWSVYALLMVLELLAFPFLSAGRFYSTPLLVQCVLLHLVSIAAVAAVTHLGALIMPKFTNVTAMLILFLAGGKIASFLDARGALISTVSRYIPNFSKLNAITRYTEGVEALGGAEFLALFAYGILFAFLPLAIGSRIFRRLPL